MRYFSLLLVSSVILGASCSCDDLGIYKTCGNPEPCYLKKNGDVDVNPKLTLQGECKLGQTACDSDLEPTCVGYVLPAEEVCDYVDNDCDGRTDEGFDLDEDGHLVCDNDCNDLDDSIYPGAPEFCDGLDNDCDGVIDEGIAPVMCWGGPQTAVFGAPSVCKKGSSQCVNGAWSNCQGQSLPSVEHCDLLDNDCDGLADNNTVVEDTPCGPNIQTGVCAEGRNTCYQGEVLCIGASYPENEVCDNADNNCNGTADEALFRPCNTACGQGVEHCASGGWIGCTAPTPQPELCDYIDNDCDSEVDEGCPCLQGQARQCRTNLIDSMGDPISCGVGVTFCDIHGTWGPCYFVGTEPEICNNWDDDCDGSIDGMTQPCGNPAYAGIGVCQLGTSTCTAGAWGNCGGAVSPQTEICDMIDNDCDGLVDEDLDPHAKVDMVLAIDISGSMCPYINALAQGITNYVQDFANTEHRFTLAVFPGWSNTTLAILTTPPLVNVGTLQAQLASLACNGGGWEPSYDVLLDLADPRDLQRIGWRADAYPYIIIVTDEPAQTGRSPSTTESQVSALTANCSVGECVSGDRYEVFVITNSGYFSMWDTITYNEPERLIEIHPPDANRYTDLLRNVFSNVCL